MTLIILCVMAVIALLVCIGDPAKAGSNLASIAVITLFALAIVNWDIIVRFGLCLVFLGVIGPLAFIGRLLGGRR